MVRIVSMGDNVVDCYLSRGEMYPGGNCLNLSAFVSRFGAQSAYVGAIGNDQAGSVITAALINEGVDISHMRRLAGQTAYCVIGHRDGDRHFVTFDLGVSMFEPTDDDFLFLSSFDAVHIGQSSGLDSFLPEVVKATRLSYDFSTKREFSHTSRIAPLCYLASISGSDLTEREIESTLRDLRSAGAKWVLVTRGKSGAILEGSVGRFVVAAQPTHVVDTLGAGDTFIARTLFGLLSNQDPAQMLDAAAKEAAKTCGYFGAIGHAAPIAIAADINRLKTSFAEEN